MGEYDDPYDYDDTKYDIKCTNWMEPDIECELEYRDKETGEVVGYWAYGWFQPGSFTDDYRGGR